MKKLYYAVLACFFTIVSCQKDPVDFSDESTRLDVVSYDSEPIDNQYIVVFEDQVAPADRSRNVNSILARKEAVGKTTSNVLKKVNADISQVDFIYSSAVIGFAARLNKEQAEELSKDDRVKFVEQDQIIALGPGIEVGKPTNPGNGGGGSQQGQETPWGINRVGGPVNSNATVWIIDTGVDLDHPDLEVDAAKSVTMVSTGQDSKSADDLNGHGTHVAGTVAAIDNELGVVGVAAGATIVAVKVLGRNGSGSTSGVIAGVDYVAENASNGDVANMSLGGGASTAIDNAVAAAAQSGIKFSLAAGNSGDDADNHSPARVNGNNIYTVSAMNSNDFFASFSNYGNPPVDYCAPGVSIKSTWKGGGYNTISGTSMAAPHVAGILSIGNISSDGTVSGDPDGNPDPIAHH